MTEAAACVAAGKATSPSGWTGMPIALVVDKDGTWLTPNQISRSPCIT